MLMSRERWNPRTIYCRLQDARLNERMVRAGKVFGRAARNTHSSDFPKVKAYERRLRANETGIEFTTEIEPYRQSPEGQAYWYQGQPGVEIIEPNIEVAIPVTIIKRRD